MNEQELVLGLIGGAAFFGALFWLFFVKGLSLYTYLGVMIGIPVLLKILGII